MDLVYTFKNKDITLQEASEIANRLNEKLKEFEEKNEFLTGYLLKEASD